MADEAPIKLREHLEKVHAEYVRSHEREHIVHADAHAREHALNQQAISKAEASVDKAVGAARETMERSLEALSDRINRAELEQRRRADELTTSLTRMQLDIAAAIRIGESISDSQTWVVRLIIGAVLLAILGWVAGTRVL